MGLRSIVQSSIRFDDVIIEPDFVLGEVGMGMKIAHEAMMECRLAMGSLSLGAMINAIQMLCRYCSNRDIATGTMIDNPVVSSMFLREIARCKAAQAFMDSISKTARSATVVPEEACLACKIIMPEEMWTLLDRAMQLLGGRGYIESNGFSRLYRDARVIRIFEGPTEVLASYLGGRILIGASNLENVLGSYNGSDIWSEIRSLPILNCSMLTEKCKRYTLLSRYHLGAGGRCGNLRRCRSQPTR